MLKKNPKRVLREIFMTKVHKGLIRCMDMQGVCDFVVNLLMSEEN